VVGAVAAGALAVGIAAVAVAGGGADDDAGPAGEVTTEDRSGPQATLAPAPTPVTAAEVFGLAGQQIVEAGSFSYAGTVSATDVSAVRPMFWLAVESTVEGQVATDTGRMHEIAVATDGTAAETVTDGPAVWGRRAPGVDSLGDQPYEAIPGLSDESVPVKGAALLPSWLISATGPVEIEADDLGRRRFQATVPATVMGEIEREQAPVDATLVLVLDQAGTPVRVEVISSQNGPPLRLAYDISALGSPVAIEPPA
jgi:hypothetical protein